MSASEPMVSIRSIDKWQEYLAAEQLQRIVWQMPDWRDAIPSNLLITIHKNGGIVLGAFDKNERLVGFVFSFLGSEEHRGRMKIKHCSHMLAVLPEYQAQKIGARLKLTQREYALAQGIDLITWTYDPLQALNANLNLARLGAIARRYIPDAYGEMTDGINAGLPSDRFQVEWWLNAPRVKECAEGKPRHVEWETLTQAGARPVFEIAFDTHHLPHIEREDKLASDSLLVEIPSDLTALKSHSAALAQEWRRRTRDLFERAFTAGYAAVDFVIGTRGERRRAAYVLTRDGKVLDDFR